MYMYCAVCDAIAIHFLYICLCNLHLIIYSLVCDHCICGLYNLISKLTPSSQGICSASFFFAVEGRGVNNGINDLD